MRFALDEFDAVAVEEAGKEKLLNPRRQWRRGGVGEDRFAAEDDGQRHFFAAGLIHAEMAGAVVVHVPVHGGFARAENLDAVHADVAVAGDGVAGVDAAEGDVAARPVFA